MNIEGSCGNQTVSDLDDLLNILRTSRKGAFGEFWIGDKDGPTLVIHINGDFAYAHYFPTEDHPGFQAIGGTDEGAPVTFTQEGECDFEMPRSVVIGVESAYQAAADFFNNLNLPTCIGWAEL